MKLLKILSLVLLLSLFIVAGETYIIDDFLTFLHPLKERLEFYSLPVIILLLIRRK